MFVDYFAQITHLKDVISMEKVHRYLEIIQCDNDYLKFLPYKHSLKAACAVTFAASLVMDPMSCMAIITADINVDIEEYTYYIEGTESVRDKVGREQSWKHEWDIVIRERQTAVQSVRPDINERELIARDGGVDVTLIVEKSLSKEDAEKGHFTVTKRQTTTLEDVLTADEISSSCCKKGLSGLTLIQPNHIKLNDMVLKKTDSRGFYLSSGWNAVVQDVTNNIDKGTKVRLFSYRVSSQLCFLLTRV